MLRLIPVLLILPFHFAAGQEIPHIEHLVQLDGYVTTYHAPGCEAKAMYLQDLLEDAVLFYEAKLEDTFDLKLLVLNREAWKYYAGTPFPLGEFSRDPYRIIMPDVNLFRFRSGPDFSLYGQNEAYFWDFVAVHELGHYIAVSQEARCYTLWLGEFFADYVQLGFMIERIPDFGYPKWFFSLWKVVPFKYKNLEACNYSEDISPANYVAYQAKFHELAQEIFAKKGWSFFNEHLVHFQELAERVRHEQKRYTSEEIFNYSVAYLEEADPEVFNNWKATMKKSPHYVIILIILAFPVAGSAVRKRFKALFFTSTVLLLLWISLFLLVRI